MVSEGGFEFKVCKISPSKQIAISSFIAGDIEIAPWAITDVVWEVVILAILIIARMSVILCFAECKASLFGLFECL